MLGLSDPFEEAIDDALNSLPGDLHAAMSNVEILVDDGAPDWQHVVLQITLPTPVTSRPRPPSTTCRRD